MGENTKIGWCDATFNPWWGCTRVSEGCRNCYAEGQAGRFGVEWGPGKERRKASEKYWTEPAKWNRKAQKAGKMARVFCASMADICDPEAPAAELPKLWTLIQSTPWLWWLLLTKRPERFPAILPSDWGEGYRNVMLMTTVEEQKVAHRAATLLKTPARAYGLSCEPLIGPVDLCDIELPAGVGAHCVNVLDAEGLPPEDDPDFGGRTIDWVIAGGESGPNARPCHAAWVLSLRDQCKATGTPFFFKQWGAWVPESQDCIGVSAMWDEWYGKKAPVQTVDGERYWRIGKDFGNILDADLMEQLPGMFRGVPEEAPGEVPDVA